MRYTLTLMRVTGPRDQDLPVPPDVVDAPPSAAFQVWWERPEDVPLPVSWPESQMSQLVGDVPRKVRLFYRVARVSNPQANILDCLPPVARVRLRLGGKGSRSFENCSASEAMETFRTMVARMVSEWGGGPADPTRAYHWDPGWELLRHDLMWIELPSGLTIRWTPWGESDEAGGHDLKPSFDELSVDEVELRDDSDFAQQNSYAPNALAYHTHMARLIREFLNLFPSAPTSQETSA